MILKKKVKRVYVGFSFSKLKSFSSAYKWITEQDDYKDKSAVYEVNCHSSVSVD